MCHPNSYAILIENPEKGVESSGEWKEELRIKGLNPEKGVESQVRYLSSRSTDFQNPEKGVERALHVVRRG